MEQAVNLDEQSSEELASHREAGSDPFFSELVRRHSDALFRFLCTKVSDPHDAEDLAQEVLLRAHSRLHLFDPRYKFQSWLFTIGTRLTYSHHRKRREVAEDTLERVDAVTPTDHMVEEEERVNLWDRVTAILPAAQAEAMWLRYGEGLSVKEIARRTGRSQVNIKVQLHRARTRLAQALDTDIGGIS